MTTHPSTPRLATGPASGPRTVRPIATLALLVLGACAPPAVVRGVDGVADALHPVAAPETTRTAPVASWSGGETVPAPARLTPARRTAPAAAPSALVGTPWVGHYAVGARRAALALTLRAPAGRASDPRPAAPLGGELTLWGVAPRTTFDGGARESGRVVRVPLAEVRLTGGTLTLATEPFLDPGCGCTVAGRFVGALRGDSLAGRFTLAGAATVAPRGGRWTLARRAAHE